MIDKQYYNIIEQVAVRYLQTASYSLAASTQYGRSENPVAW